MDRDSSIIEDIPTTNGFSSSSPPSSSSCWKALTFSRHLFGVCLLLIVVVIWVVSSQLMQYIFTDEGFNSPFFLTYLNTTLFIIYLPMSFLKLETTLQKLSPRLSAMLKKERQKNYREKEEEEGEEEEEEEKEGKKGNREKNENSIGDFEVHTKGREVIGDIETSNVPLHYQESISSSSSSTTMRRELLGNTNENTPPPFTNIQLAKIAIMFCPIWFLANYTFNASLSLTSVSSNTILSSTSGMFTLFFSILVRVDKFSVVKLVAVLFSFCGVIFVSINDEDSSGKNSLLGDGLALMSAVFYGVYTVFLKYAIGDESRLDMMRFLGFVGLFNMAFMWPFMIVLNYAGIEKFIIPTGYVILYLILNALIGTVLSDYLWIWTVLLTTPLISTVGLSLTIPFAIFSDVLLARRDFQLLYLIGGASVVLGFIAINTDKQLTNIVSNGKQKLIKKWRDYRNSHK